MPNPTDNRIKIVLADPNPLILSGMAEKFSANPLFSLVATVRNSQDFLSTVMRGPVDLGIVCWSLPQLGAEKVIEVLREYPSAPRILVYSQNQSKDVPRRAMAAGAAGYCDKEQTVDELISIAASVAQGKMVFPFMDIRDLQADPLFSLTKRERILLEYLSDGMTNKELAGVLEISVNTIKFHLSNLYEKLEVRNRAQAIAFFYSRRLDTIAEPEGGLELRSK